MHIEHKGMLIATKLLALTAIEFINTPELVEKSKEEI